MNGSIFFLLFQDGSQLFGLVPVQHLVDVPKLEALTPGTLDKTKGPSGKPRYIFFKKNPLILSHDLPECQNGPQPSPGPGVIGKLFSAFFVVENHGFCQNLCRLNSALCLRPSSMGDVAKRGDPERGGSDFTFLLFPSFPQQQQQCGKSIFLFCEVYSSGSF